jgi:quinol monooxygenase YgiN
MTSITIIACLTALAGKEEELAAQLRELVPATRAETGCVEFKAHRHSTRLNRFFVFEKFADKLALDAHLACSHTQRFLQWIETNEVVFNVDFWDEMSASAVCMPG